ncbi:adenylyltransferase/cytidyltransferase family protein [Stenotrophomonas nitritireducens]|uniref:adenylyltransferase/cytidyltransferase family protein n=1 Tax=Stenotrophomonas nitritireducens TaxID=83617 RepID=UPI003D96193C
MTLVLTYGTFDLLHVGHVNLLRRARALGDRLIVGLSSDRFNAIKNKTATQCYADREAVLRAIRYVDDVFPEESWDQKAADIHRHGAALLVMGSDWTGHFDALSCHCEVRYLPRTEDISSSSIKARIRRDDVESTIAGTPLVANVLAGGSR